jgi:hypothetical protein
MLEYVLYFRDPRRGVALCWCSQATCFCTYACASCSVRLRFLPAALAGALLASTAKGAARTTARAERRFTGAGATVTATCMCITGFKGDELCRWQRTGSRGKEARSATSAPSCAIGKRHLHGPRRRRGR